MTFNQFVTYTIALIIGAGIGIGIVLAIMKWMDNK